MRSNYELTFNNATLTVNPLDVSVVADSAFKNASDPDPVLTFVSVPAVGTTLPNGQLISFSGSLARVAGEAAGKYKIIENTLGNSNHSINFTGALFTISVATGTKPVFSDAIELTAYPNPFTDHLYIDLQLTSDARVSLEIYNSLGVKLATVLDAYLNSSDRNILEYTPKNLSSGMLIYRLIINEKLSLTGKLIFKK